MVAYILSNFYDEETYGPKEIPRALWPGDDPTLISEGVFAMANVFSFARIIYLFQANPQLGPLQISLGCMLIDIGKFLFIFFLVLTSFACGLNQLYYYYSIADTIVVGPPTYGHVDNGTGTGATPQVLVTQPDPNFENAFDP